jgi:hypothetical protein
MGKLKITIAQELRMKTGIDADLQLVGALVNVCVALRKAAEAHTTESKDLMLIKDEFEYALAELMNCSSMSSRENVIHVLRKQYIEPDVVAEHVLWARTLSSGPLFLCMENDLTKILSTPQVKGLISSVFYASLKQTTSLPVRNLLDVFQLRSASNTCRYRPFAMFTLECLLMPSLCLCMVAYLAIAKSADACVENVWGWFSILCACYEQIKSLLILYVVGRFLYEVGEIHYTFTTHWRIGNATWRVVYELLCDLCRHILFDAWNVMDFVNIICLSYWAYYDFRDNRILTWSVISLGFVVLRFVSLWQEPGQQMVKVIAIASDLKPFAYLLFFGMVGFGLVFHFLFSNHERFSTFPKTMIVLFDASVGKHDFDIFHGDAVGIFMMVVYVLVLWIVFFKFMDVRVSVSHENLNANAPEMWCRAQARNTREFLLLREWNPLCMLPPPLNILAILVWIMLDFLPYCYQQSHGISRYLPPTYARIASTLFNWLVLEPIRLGTIVLSYFYYRVRDACFPPTTKFIAQETAKILNSGKNKASVLSVAGTFSDVVIAIITLPFHAVREVYLAYWNVAEGIYKDYFTIVLVVMLPFWILSFCFMIIWNTFRLEDKTYATSIFGGHIRFPEAPLVSYKLGYDGLYVNFLASAIVTLVWICPLSSTRILCQVANTCLIPDSVVQTNMLAVLQVVYHHVVFHSAVYLLLVVGSLNAREYNQETKPSKNSSAQSASDTNAGAAAVYEQIAKHKPLHLARLCVYLMLYAYDLRCLFLTEITELCACAFLPMIRLRKPANVQIRDYDQRAELLGCTNIDGQTKSREIVTPGENDDVLEVKVIRARLEAKALTIFGTNTHPFVVIKYLRSKMRADLETVGPGRPAPDQEEADKADKGDMFYTKTDASNPQVPEFHQSFEFVLRKGDLELEFIVYDRVGDHVRYMYGATYDIRKWYSNRRFESEIRLQDSMNRPSNSILQIDAKVRNQHRQVHKTDTRHSPPEDTMRAGAAGSRSRNGGSSSSSHMHTGSLLGSPSRTASQLDNFHASSAGRPAPFTFFGRRAKSIGNANGMDDSSGSILYPFSPSPRSPRSPQDEGVSTNR